MWAFALFSYSLVSPKTTPPLPSCAVKLSSSTGGVWKSNWTARQQMISLGVDLDLLEVLFSKMVYCFLTQAPPWCLSKGQIIFAPRCFPFFTLFVFSFFSPWCAYLVLFSTSVSYSCFVPLILHVILSLSQRSFALRIHKLLSCRRGHRVRTVII